ncbi:MAG: AzlC family ABC transporter permease [Propionibacteriaceae bacterium]|jgi:4-azaleucine resistance transporter AzlC|nr:AzlC family ABC transporter permease [Propionibacteriaceae bacterium]
MRESLKAAAPIMGGYLVLGIPCGILGAQAGMSALQIGLMSLIFYSGAGQYLIANMVLAGVPVGSIIASVSLVNTRQLLYAAALAPYTQSDGKLAATAFAATVTDESFGVNLERYQSTTAAADVDAGASFATRWTIRNATLVNVFSWLTWCGANLIGVFVGEQLQVPSELAAFAMTAIFLCLLLCQPATRPAVVAALGAGVAMVICKWAGLNGPAIIVSALIGIAAAMGVRALDASRADPAATQPAVSEAVA